MTDPTEPERPDHGMPSWVKVFVALALLILVVVVVLQFVGGGDHSPGRHL